MNRPCWTETVNKITKWVLNPPTRPPDAPPSSDPDAPAVEPPNVAFGHIQGALATGKTRKLPVDLARSIQSACCTFGSLTLYPTFSIVHVVAELEKLPLSHSIQESSSLGWPRPPMIVTYQDLLERLKRTRRNGGWEIFPFASSTFFLIEVDPDFSAAFFLALNAAVVFSLSITGEQPQTRMRVATMGWEPADGLYSRLFRPGEAEITTLVLPGRRLEPFNECFVGEGEQEPFKAISEVQGRLSPDLTQAVLYLHDKHDLPPTWEKDEWKARGWSQKLFQLGPYGFSPFQTSSEEGRRLMYHVPCGMRMLESLREAGYVHIVPSRFRRRPIFDLETRQVVHVDLQLSQSERGQQLSWVDRTECPRSRVLVYSSDGSEDVSGSRLKDILNSQLAGFIAGLAQFEDWPRRIRSLKRLHHLFALEDECIKGAVDQTLQRLKLQGLLSTVGTEMDPILSLQRGIPQAFFKVLPLVNYDSQLAYMLVDPRDHDTTWFKVQVAIMVIMGPGNFLSTRFTEASVEDISSIRKSGMHGFGSHFANVGSLWMVLGLVRSAIDARKSEDPDHHFTDGSVFLHMATAIEWERRCFDLLKVLTGKKPNVDILCHLAPQFSEYYDALCLHLLPAFTFQIGVISFTEDDRIPTVHDLASGVEMAFDDRVLALVDFRIVKSHGPEKMVGFYTSLSRSKNDPKTTITDWNWISPEIWEQWLAANKPIKDSLAHKHELGRNPHEFERL